jgi:hypothetical protein
MRVFVSSVIVGMEPFREAAREAIEACRGTPVMAEDFTARPDSPQIACLTELRGSDVELLLLGDRYGGEQASGLSATHEEYMDARNSKRVLVFVRNAVVREPKQCEFLAAVEAYETGRFRVSFDTVKQLRVAIIQALHDLERARTSERVDHDALTERARRAVPGETGGSSHAGPSLHLAVVGAPRRQLLRPAQIEDPELASRLRRDAQYGAAPLFDPAAASPEARADGRLVLDQGPGRAAVSVNEEGTFMVRLPLPQPPDKIGFPILIAEVVEASLLSGLAFVSEQLQQMDSTQTMTDVGIAVRISNAEHAIWRTRREHQMHTGAVTLGFGQRERPIETEVLSRAELRLDSKRVVEDLVVRFSRQFKP